MTFQWIIIFIFPILLNEIHKNYNKNAQPVSIFCDAINERLTLEIFN